MMNNPLIITCAIVGAELTRDDTPYLPLTPEELVLASVQAIESGASVIHLHVRDEAGRPSQSVEIFEEVTEKIRRRCDCIIQYSTGGAVGTPLNERAAPLVLKPDMASLSMGTMNFAKEIFENSENTICQLAGIMKKKGIVPELEIFDLGMVDTMDRFIKKGHLPEKFHVQFVLGVPGGLNGELRNLITLVDRLEECQSWSVAGIGSHELPLATHAIAMGGYVRVGLEDNIYYRKGQLARSNAEIVERIVRIAGETGRPVATVAEAKEVLLL